MGTEENATGWKDNTDCDLRLSFRGGDIAIEVFEGDTRVVHVKSNDATFRGGKSGFYNYSQPTVRYEAFAVNSL